MDAPYLADTSGVREVARIYREPKALKANCDGRRCAVDQEPSHAPDRALKSAVEVHIAKKDQCLRKIVSYNAKTQT